MEWLLGRVFIQRRMMHGVFAMRQLLIEAASVLLLLHAAPAALCDVATVEPEALLTNGTFLDICKSQLWVYLGYYPHLKKAVLRVGRKVDVCKSSPKLQKKKEKKREL